MSAIAEQMAATLQVIAAQVADAVVTCGHTYTDAGGAHSQTFDALVSNVTADQQVRLTGSLNNELRRLVIDIATARAAGTALDVLPVAGDKITIQRGDDATLTRTVISTDVDGTESMLTLIVGAEYA